MDDGRLPAISNDSEVATGEVWGLKIAEAAAAVVVVVVVVEHPPARKRQFYFVKAPRHAREVFRLYTLHGRVDVVLTELKRMVTRFDCSFAGES